MATISITFDTVEKKLETTLDGKKIKGVRYIDIHSFEEGAGGMTIETVDSNSAEDGFYKVTKIYAKADGEMVIETEDMVPDVPIEEVSKALLPHRMK
jgi:hypothetical protein